MPRKSTPASNVRADDTDSAAFEQLLEQLEDIVGRMEAGNLPLEETLREFERGQRLASACDARLRDATQRVQKLLGDTAETPPEVAPPDSDDATNGSADAP